jgi:hypothetical protein
VWGTSPSAKFSRARSATCRPSKPAWRKTKEERARSRTDIDDSRTMGNMEHQRPGDRFVDARCGPAQEVLVSLHVSTQGGMAQEHDRFYRGPAGPPEREDGAPNRGPSARATECVSPEKGLEAVKSPLTGCPSPPTLFAEAQVSIRSFNSQCLSTVWAGHLADALRPVRVSESALPPYSRENGRFGSGEGDRAP